MAYTTINKSTDHFNTILYTGNGSTQSITGVGFQPDWVWIKDRSLTEAYFMDKEQNYFGKLKLINILNKSGNSINFKEKDHIIINPNQSIYEIMNILKDFVGESIPVVNDKNKLIGVISENDVLKAYDQITQTIRNIEKN